MFVTVRLLTTAWPLVHRVWRFCRVSADEGLLPVLSAKLLGSVKLMAAGFLSSWPFRRQMDGVPNDVVLARWQCRLLKSPHFPQV